MYGKKYPGSKEIEIHADVNVTLKTNENYVSLPSTIKTTVNWSACPDLLRNFWAV